MKDNDTTFTLLLLLLVFCLFFSVFLTKKQHLRTQDHSSLVNTEMIMQSSHHSTVWSAGFVDSEAIKTLVSFVQMWTPVTLFLDFQIKKAWLGSCGVTCDTKSVPQHRCFCLSEDRGNIIFSYLRQESIKCCSSGYLKTWFQILIWNLLNSLTVVFFIFD